MRRTFVFAATAVAALSLGCGAWAGSSGARPALRLVDRSPLTVRGSSFDSGEAVRVVYRRSGSARIRRVHASAEGAFTARFAGVTLHVCDGGTTTITARGASSGTVAIAKLPVPLCPPPLSP